VHRLGVQANPAGSNFMIFSYLSRSKRCSSICNLWKWADINNTNNLHRELQEIWWIKGLAFTPSPDDTLKDRLDDSPE
jgi:hypothetical protein